MFLYQLFSNNLNSIFWLGVYYSSMACLSLSLSLYLNLILIVILIGLFVNLYISLFLWLSKKFLLNNSTLK